MKPFLKLYLSNAAFLEDEAAFREGYTRVLPVRQAKIDAVSAAKDKRLSLAAGLLLKYAMEDNGFVYPDSVFGVGEQDKPFDKAERFCFNLSHSERMVLAAVSSGPVGCDVQNVGKFDLRIAKRFFHPDEYQTIASLSDPEEQKNCFYRIWTLKESYLKLTGSGFSTSPDSFCVSLTPEVRFRGNDEIHFSEKLIDTDYRCACCSVLADKAEWQMIDLTSNKKSVL